MLGHRHRAPTVAALVLVVLLCLATVAQPSPRNLLHPLLEPVGQVKWARGLLQSQQTPNCSRVHPACQSCRYQRVPGTRRSDLVCSVCISGWRLRRDGRSKTCDCSPGFSFDGGNWCAPCPTGKYCIGGDMVKNPTNEAFDCPPGLQTILSGAKSDGQCFTQPGYGRDAARGANGIIILSGYICPVGTYNVGRNTFGCQKCGPGLTTAETGSTNSTACMAPPGSYFDRGVGKLCQKGTYSLTLNSEPNCIPCAPGVTTEQEGSSSAEACILAERGYRMVGATTAAPCPLDTYNDEETPSTTCKPCPHGWRTKAEGADGPALCLAPPGWELKDGALTISECEVGYFKQDWNRNACVPCGSGLVTAATGSVSRDACLVPPGMGLVSIFPLLAAEMCRTNKYGDSQYRTATSNARCVACPNDMYTLDMITGEPASSGYTSEEACLVAPGWGTTNTLPQKCRKGTYNAGKNRQPCMPCPTGMTTNAEGATIAEQCVVQPGWEMRDTGPHPCNKGSYSTGGTVLSPNVSCSPCDEGFTTQVDASASQADCSVCAAGYGGGLCNLCPYNSFSYGGGAVGDPCTPCPADTVSRRGAKEAQMCYSKLIDVTNDVFRLADEAAWEPAPSATSAVACGELCAFQPPDGAQACITYRFAQEGMDCQLFREAADGEQVLGLKIGNAADYVVYRIPGSQSFGQLVGLPLVRVSQAECAAACSSSSECEAFSIPVVGAIGDCRLMKSELDAAYTGMFAVRGNRLLSDAVISSTIPS